MKKLIIGLVLTLSGGWATAQNAPTASFKQAFAAGEAAEKIEHWEQAEASYAICLAQAPTDTTVIKSHAYAAANSLDRHARKPDVASGFPDYLPLAVKDYDALIAAGRARYLLDKATAYATRAEASDPAEAKVVIRQALDAISSYEKVSQPTSYTRQLRGALMVINH